MTLLNAPEFNEVKENRTHNILVGSGVSIVAIALIAVVGFLLGHGWFFMNLPVKRKVQSSSAIPASSQTPTQDPATLPTTAPPLSLLMASS